MTIKSLEIYRASIPLTQTEPKQLWLEEWSNQLLVKVCTEDICGWGETLPAAGNTREPYIDLVRRLKSVIIGMDERRIREIHYEMRRATFTGGYGVVSGAISSVDIALWDILGRRSGLPIYSIFGGGNEVRRYVSLSRYKGPDVVKVIERLLEKGYKEIKLHQPPRETLEAVKEIRLKYGYNFELMVDLNCGFTFEESLNFINKVQRYELKWIEEPLWPPDDLEGLSKLNKLLPIAIGENLFSVFDFMRAVELNSATFLQPDVTKIGGITPLLDVLTFLKLKDVSIALHNRPHNGWLGILVGSHVVAGLGLNSAIIETPPNEIPLEFFKSDVVIDANKITLGGEGLGIAPTNIPQNDDSRILRF
ncbi:enolase [Sulfolobales archaeon HS-7]|nr:enolase [Sulfolobales archaeon HS-7]